MIGQPKLAIRLLHDSMQGALASLTSDGLESRHLARPSGMWMDGIREIHVALHTIR